MCIECRSVKDGTELASNPLCYKPNEKHLELGWDEYINHLEVPREGANLLCVTDNCLLVICDRSSLATVQLLKQDTPPSEKSEHGHGKIRYAWHDSNAAISPDGVTIVACGTLRKANYDPSLQRHEKFTEVRFLRLEEGQFEVTRIWKEFEFCITAVDFSPDGSLLVMGGNTFSPLDPPPGENGDNAQPRQDLSRGFIKVLDGKNFNLLQILTGLQDYSTKCLSFSPDG